LRRTFYTLSILFGIIAFEVVFIALSTTYMQVQFRSPVLGNFRFFMVLLQEAPLTSLKLIIVEQPLFIIEAKHHATAATVWSLHYFSITVLIHVFISQVIANIISRSADAFRWRDIPFTGSVLLLFSSLYLFLGSCCTGGPNWIFHTWLLAVVFNPITSSNATIQLYQMLKDGFVIWQVLTGVLGGYLLYRNFRKT